LFVIELFITAKLQNEHRCSSTDERAKMWGIFTIEYYLPIKSKIMLFAGPWIKLEVFL
jgi:hypothetical protein